MHEDHHLDNDIRLRREQTSRRQCRSRVDECDHDLIYAQHSSNTCTCDLLDFWEGKIDGGNIPDTVMGTCQHVKSQRHGFVNIYEKFVRKARARARTLY
jgi:hypothetical protein